MRSVVWCNSLELDKGNVKKNTGLRMNGETKWNNLLHFSRPW